MQPKSFIVALAASALVALPALASAEVANPNGANPPYNGGWNNGGWHGRAADRDDRRDGDNRRDRGGDRGGYNRPYNNGGYNGGNQGRNQFSGRVTGFSPYNLSVAGEPPIHLHNGTVINPTGTTLQPGMRVQVSGHPNGDGSFEADQITVMSPNNGGYNGGYNGRWGR